MLAADLAASLTYSPGTYYPGQTIAQAVLSEVNVGADAADGYATRIVLSTDTTLGNDDDVQLARIDRTGDPLGPGQLAQAPRTLTIPPAAAAGRYYLFVQSDVDNQVTESVEGNNLWAGAAADIVIAKPTVTIAATDRTASEAGINTGRFRIARTGPTDAPLTVAYTIGGTATASGAGADFEELTGTATIAAGQAGVNIVVRPINDSRVEGVERVVLTLNEADGLTIGGTGAARVDINDNDGAKVRIVAADAAASETDQGTAMFTVSRAGSRDGGLVVRYTLAGTARNGVDYVELPGEVTIPDGEASASITLTPIDDDAGELSETVTLTLSKSALYLVVASRRIARATIVDNEPVVKVAATVGRATETGARAGTVMFTRVGASASPLTVVYTLEGTGVRGADYLDLTGMVTIPAGSLTAAITLTPIDDAIAEGNETVVLLLAAGDGYRVDTARRRATVNITDNEPTVSITASDATATENNTTVATFTVSRTGTPAGDLTVNYSVAGTASGGEGGGGDYIALPGSVTIPDGQVSALITLMPIDDSVGEGSETVILTLTAGTAYSRNAARTTARAAIADNEPAVSITATDSAAAEVTDAEPNVGMFTVVRTGSTVGSLTIPYTVSGSAATDGTDYAVVEGSITIPDGSSNATITVTPVDDGSAEPGETVSITLTGNSGYVLSTSRRSATVTIADNEPIVSIAATDSSADEGDASVAVFTVSRAVATPQEVVVNFTITGTAAGAADFQIIASSVTIPAEALSATVTITPVQDSLGEGDETVILTIAENPAYTVLTAGNKNKATVTIRDDEPVVSIAATDNTATEQDETDAVFTLTRTGNSDQMQEELTVTYRVEGAADGDDFEALDGEVIFAAGAARATITITAIDDGEGEASETVVISLEADDGAVYSVDAAKAAATVNVTDNEPLVTIAATDGAAAENNNPGVFTIRRTGSTAEELVVNYTVSGTATAGDDFAALSGSVTIPADASSATVTITPVYDRKTEGSETVKLTLSAGGGYRADAGVAVVTIANAQAVDLDLLNVGYVGRTYSLASAGVTAPIVLNIGNTGEAASAGFTAELRLSTNSVWGDEDDVVIGTVSCAAMAGGGSGAITFTFDLDAVKSRLAAGAYRLAARLDHAFRVLEASESNNTYMSGEANIVIEG